MAELSRQEFQELCGISDGTLRKQISRGKVLEQDDGKGGKFIDTTNPVNKLFKDKQKQLRTQKNELQQLINQIPANTLPKPQTSKAQFRQVIMPASEGDEDALPPMVDTETLRAMEQVMANGGGDEMPNAGGGLQQWLLMKMKGDAQLVTVRVQVEKLKLDKTAGKLVPVDVAAEILRSQARTIFVNFENSIENIANIFCQIMAGGNMDMFTRIREEARKELKVAINKAGADADVEMERIINTYAEGNKL